MVLVDSSVWILYFNGRKTWQTEILDQMLQQFPVYTGDLILTEVFQGFRKDSDYQRARAALSILPCKEMGGYELAIQSAENYRKLDKKGVTVRKTIDAVVGTFCIAKNIPLMQSNKDFNPMIKLLSLKTISPALPPIP